MADEKLNVSPEENPQPSLFDAGPEGAPAQDAPAPEPPAPENAPEQTGGEPPAQDAPAGAPGAVNVSADQIEKLMAERRAAGRAEVEKNEPPEPEQPPTPAPEEKAVGEKGPAKKDKAAKEKAPEPDKSKGSGYEIIAGHRRQRASELAGFANMPCIVRNMTDDEAILAMTDDNLRHREKILPMEKAQSLKMQVEAISHQGTKMEGVPAGDVGKRSTEIVGERNGMNYKQVQRYIRLTELVPELQSMVNEKKLSFTPAVEISFIKPKNQRFIAVSIEGEQASPSLSQAQELRKLDKDGKLNGDVIDGILSREKKEVDKVIISAAELNKYFGKDTTPREMKDQIMSLLDAWKEKQPPERTAPEKKTDREK